jgi:cytochrome P450
MAFKDPLEHSRLRNLLNRAPEARRRCSLSHSIQAMIDVRLGPILARSSGEFEFIEQFGNPLPASVIMDLLGVSISDMPEVRRWSAQIHPFIGEAAVAEDK